MSVLHKHVYAKRFIGIDPANDRVHYCHVTLDGVSGELLDVVAATFDKPNAAITDPGARIAVEDPRGVLFGGKNSKSWSETCAIAGGAYWCGLPRAEWVTPQEARMALAEDAGQTGLPRSDSEVRQLLMAIYGDACFSKAKTCRKSKNKSHGPDCILCDGTGHETAAGILSALTSTHYRDAFVAARFLMRKA